MPPLLEDIESQWEESHLQIAGFKTVDFTAERGFVLSFWGGSNMNNKLAEMRSRLIVALDVSDRNDALKLVEQLSPEVGAFKVGMQLYNSTGPAIVKDIQDAGGNVFIDLKFHDIPNTVGQAARVMSRKGAFMYTVHAGGGSKMLQAAADSAAEEAKYFAAPRPLSLAVTVLTSLSQEELSQELAINRSVAEHVVALAKMAKASGIDGVVCSPQELDMVRAACGDDFLIVTPGVRPRWAAVNDQKRIMTPKEAIARGASYIVVGRPILKAESPVEAARKIVTEMAE